MPLRVWISPGKKLPEEPISSINAQRPQEVLAMLKQDPNMLLNLPQCGGWTEQMNAAAKTGIEQWREFENEGLFSFQFVDDPAQANIFVFWAERFTGDEGVGGISTGGNTVAVLYDANQVHTRESQIGQAVQGTPVIIELQTRDDSFEQLQARVAHEFGHALGIKEHSPYNQDLMCVNGIAKMLSASDKATIRWLYKQNTPYVMLPPIVPPSGSRTLATQSQSGAEENTNTGSGTERSGGYKIRASAPDPGSGQAAAPELQYRVPNRSTIDETGAKTYERPNLDFLNEDGRSKKEREKTDSKKEEKKSRDRKKKSESTDNSGATGGTPTADPAESAQTGETQPKASDGY